MQMEIPSLSVVRELFLLTWKDTCDLSVGFANATYNIYIIQHNLPNLYVTEKLKQLNDSNTMVTTLSYKLDVSEIPISMRNRITVPMAAAV